MNEVTPPPDESPVHSKSAERSAAAGEGALELPAPADRPDADVVIYDGECRFCRTQVRRLARLDVARRLAFISLHDPEVPKRWPDLTHEQLMQEMVVVTATGERHAGAGALRYLTRRLFLLWPLAPFLHVPGSMPLWRWLYAQVARRRYLIAGRVDTCDDGACRVQFPR